jgi:hypothetical protein
VSIGLSFTITAVSALITGASLWGETQPVIASDKARVITVFVLLFICITPKSQ